jgi:opacity protein-like surface antigen
MRYKITLFLILASFSVSTAALANEPYVAVSGGVTLPEDSNNRGQTTSNIPATVAFGAIPTGTAIAWDTKFKTGYDLSLHAGYRLDGGLRAELQGFFNANDIDGHRNLTVGGANIDAVDSAVLTRGAASAANPRVGQILADGRGKVKAYGVIANAFYDFNKGGSLQPFVGAGAGFQRTDIRFTPSGVDIADAKKTVFAYQLMAGATYKIGPSLEVFGQYTFRNPDRARIPLNLLPANLGVQSKKSILSLGLRLPLGGGK